MLARNRGLRVLFLAVGIYQTSPTLLRVATKTHWLLRGLAVQAGAYLMAKETEISATLRALWLRKDFTDSFSTVLRRN